MQAGYFLYNAVLSTMNSYIDTKTKEISNTLAGHLVTFADELSGVHSKKKRRKRSGILSMKSAEKQVMREYDKRLKNRNRSNDVHDSDKIS